VPIVIVENRGRHPHDLLRARVLDVEESVGAPFPLRLVVPAIGAADRAPCDHAAQPRHVVRAEDRHASAARVAEEEGGKSGILRLRVARGRGEIGELDRVGVAGEEIEPVERIGLLADAASRHVEAADGEAGVAEVFGEPGKESPVLESLPAVNDDDERTRMPRRIEVAPDGQALV